LSCHGQAVESSRSFLASVPCPNQLESKLSPRPIPLFSLFFSFFLFRRFRNEGSSFGIAPLFLTRAKRVLLKDGEDRGDLFFSTPGGHGATPPPPFYDRRIGAPQVKNNRRFPSSGSVLRLFPQWERRSGPPPLFRLGRMTRSREGDSLFLFFSGIKWDAFNANGAFPNGLTGRAAKGYADRPGSAFSFWKTIKILRTSPLAIFFFSFLFFPPLLSVWLFLLFFLTSTVSTGLIVVYRGGVVGGLLRKY